MKSPAPDNGTASASTPEERRESRAAFLLSLVCGVALLALMLTLLAPLGPTAVDLADIDKVLVLERQYLKPEPLERFLYVSGVLLLPFCLGIAHRGVRRWRETPHGRRAIAKIASPASWLLAPLVLVLLFSAGRADDGKTVRLLIPGGMISLAVAVALAAAATAAAGSRFRAGWVRVQQVLLPGLAVLLLLAILAFAVLGPEHIRNAPIFWASFNAFFYSIVQVFLGKELLVDFMNLYGLYPHFLEPVFSLVGLSVYTLSALMGVLNCLSYYWMYRFLARETEDGLLAFLGLTTIIFTGYVSGRVAQPDLYFQYQPLRILFPAAALPLVRTFGRNPTLRLGALLFALGAAAFLWNPDTGVIVLAATFLLLVYDALLRRRPREIPPRLLAGAAAACAVLAAFAIFLRVRFGAFPDFSKLFLYPKAFYLYGTMMLPMPPFGLWVPVLLVYAAALLLALAALLRGEATPRARIFFFLSVLGLGLFTYYQGRSNLGNLTSAGYPAVLIVVLLACDLQRSALPRPAAAERLLSVTILALLFYSLPALATVAPAWIRGIAEKVRVTRSGMENDVLRDAKFLSRYVRPGQEVVILSYNSGFHHLMTQTTNPLDIPGDSELLYRKDHEKQSDFVRWGRGLFVIDKNTMTPSFVAAARRTNKVSYDNPQGSLVVFPGGGRHRMR